jgi:hypothetical protein
MRFTLAVFGILILSATALSATIYVPDSNPRDCPPFRGEQLFTPYRASR